MQEFQGLLLVSDIDETAIYNYGDISEENREAIRYFEQNGGVFTFATGRRVSGTKKFIEQAGVTTPVVVDGGSVLYSPFEDKIIYEETLSGNPIELIDEALKLPYDIGIEICKGLDQFVIRENKDTRAHEDKLNTYFKRASIDEIPFPWTKMNLVVDPSIRYEVYKAFEGTKFDKRYEIFQTPPEFIEILPKGITKANGLKKLSEYFSIPMQNIIALGDNENDVDMLKTAGIAVAVGNATDSVKAVADFIVVSCEKHAVADLVYKLEEIV